MHLRRFIKECKLCEKLLYYCNSSGRRGTSRPLFTTAVPFPRKHATPSKPLAVLGEQDYPGERWMPKLDEAWNEVAIPEK